MASDGRRGSDTTPPRMSQPNATTSQGVASRPSGSPQAGGTGGPTRRAGGRGGRKQSYSYSPYAKPPSGRQQRPQPPHTASGTPLLPPSAPRPPSTPPASSDAMTPAPLGAAPPAAGSPATPSTLGRLLTPIRAAGGYFLGRVWGSSASSPAQEDGSAEDNEDGPITLTDADGTPIADITDAPLPEIGMAAEMAMDTPPAAKPPSQAGKPRENSDPSQQTMGAAPEVSLLAALKQGNRPGQTPTPNPVLPAGPSAAAPPTQLTPPAAPSALVGGDIGAYATPYRSVLALLQEGPTGRKVSTSAAPQITSRQIPFTPAAASPTLPALQQSLGQTPSLRGSRTLGIRAPPGLFSMGMSPATSAKTRHRTASRSAVAKRTPVSATPLHMTQNTGREGLAAPPTAPKPTSPGAAWTPMRSSTMALVEQYERKDTSTQKRTRSSANSPVASEAGGTPLVGSGISSLKSYAFQQPVYRRRVRAKQDTASGTYQLGNTPRPAPPVPRAAPVGQTNDDPAKSKLTTETARRILRTLDTLVAQTPPKALPAPRSPLALPAPAPALPTAEKAPAVAASEAPVTTAAAVSSAAALPGQAEKPKTSGAPAAGGWGDAFLKSNAASFASATTAAEKEIQEKAAGSSAAPAPATGGWGDDFLKSNASALAAASKAAEKDIEDNNKGPAPAPAGSTFTFGVTSKATQPSFTFGAASTSPTKQAEPTQGFSFSPSAPAVTPAKEGLKPPIAFGAPVSAGSPSKARSKPSASSPSAAPEAGTGRRVTFSFGSEAKEASTPSTSTTPSPSKPFGGQTPVFSFGGLRTSEEDLAVKAATAGRHPSGREPVYEFGNGILKAPSGAAKTPPPGKAVAFSVKEQAEAEANVKAAASTPLPGSDDDDDDDSPAKTMTPSPATTGGWGTAFLQANASASVAAASSAKEEIEKKEAGAKPSAAAAGLFSTGQLSSPASALAVAQSSSPAATTGWGDTFLKQNASAHAAAVSAVQKEIEKTKNPPPAVTPSLFGFGAPKPAEDSVPPISRTTAAQPPASASGSAPAAGGWDLAFLSSNTSQAGSATEAAKEAIKEASGAAPATATDTPPTASGGLFSFGAPSSAAAAAASTGPTAASAPAMGLFSFGGASTPAPAAASTAPVTFSFGGPTASSASASASSAASMATFSFGGASASAPSASSAPIFSFGGASSAASAPPAAAAAPSSGPTFAFGGAAPTPAAQPQSSPAPSLLGTAMSMGSEGSGGGLPAASAPPAGTFAFGGASSAPATNFGPAGTPASAPSFGSAVPAFGGASSAPSFGSAAASPFGASSAPTFGATAASAFGAAPAASFGQTPAPSFGAPVGGSFGSGAAASAPAFAFGGGAPAAGSSPSFAFGGGAPAAAPAPFGAPQPQAAPGGFGAIPGQQPAAFGASQPAQPFAFGAGAGTAAPSANPFGSAQPGGFSGAPAGAPAFSFGTGMGQQAPGAFGGAPAGGPAGDAMGGFSMGQGQQQQQAGPAGRRLLKVRRAKRGGK